MRRLRSRLRLEVLEPRELLNASAFPDTQNGIFLLSDQLNGGLSNQLVQFIASHYAGTQKLLPSENARYRADNPNWVLLDYRLATASGPVPYITGGQWGSDWGTVTSNESWFMHDASGNRLFNGQWDWYLHDITNPAFRQYWVSSVIADLRTNGAQGVFADSFDAGVGDGWFTVSDPRFSGTNAANPAAWPGGYTWVQQLQDLISYVEAAFRATPEQFKYIPNLDALVTGWYNLDTSNLDGAFLEGFGDWGPPYLSGSPSDWVLSMNRALGMSDAGKILIMQPYLKDTPDSATGQLQRGFDLGTYLLLKGQHTYLNLVAGGSSSGAYYYPEDTLNLGPAVTPLASNVSQYLWGGVYRRDFQNGVVLVNPGNSPITVDMGQVYEQVAFSGGGALTDSSLDAAGRFVGGSLSETPVRVVTLAPGSAAFLMNAPTTGGTAPGGTAPGGTAPGGTAPGGTAPGGGTNTAAGRASTPGVFDPATATWYLRNEVGSGSPDAGAFSYGAAGWVPVVGDWQGTGHSGIGVVNPGTATWYLRNEVSSGSPDAGVFRYGAAGWVPVVGDWNGTGHVGIGMFDPGTGTWYLRNEDNAGPPDAGVFRYGAAGWVPVVGDWNGDGKSTVGVVDPRTMTWYLRNSNSAGAPDITPFQYGAPGWKPVVGDWDGNGTTTVGAVNPATETWYLRDSDSAGAPSYAPFGYGLGRWDPVVGNYSLASAAVISAARRRTDALDAVFAGGAV